MSNSLKQRALRKFAQANHTEALEFEATKIASALAAETQYDIIKENLELLDVIAYRVHGLAAKLFGILLDRLDTITLTYAEAVGFSVERLREFQNNALLIKDVLESIEHIRYHEPHFALDIFFRYSVHPDEKVSKQAIHGIGLLAEFNLDIFYGDGKDWKGLGWEPQEKVLEKIEALDPKSKVKYLSAISTACDHILSPNISGSTWNYKSVTMRSGPIPALPGIVQLRSRTLAFLKDYYALFQSNEQKETIISTLQSSTRTPNMGRYSDDILQMIMENSVCVLEFFAKLIATEPLDILQRIEHDAYFLQRRGHSDKVKEAALAVKSALDIHAEYQIFKILIGFRGVFDEWGSEPEENSYQREKALREETAAKFAASVNESNYAVWKGRILQYAQIQSNDLATFPYFGQFLENLGSIAPDITLKLLEEELPNLRRFLVPILLGLWKSVRRDKIHKIITSWIDQSKELFLIARFMEHCPDLDENLLMSLFVAAQKADDTDTLSQICGVITEKYDQQTKHLVAELMLPIIKILSAHKSSSWIFSFWFRQKRELIINELNSTGIEVIIDNLLWINKVDYHVEDLLSLIAEKFPEQVVSLFCARIKHGETDALEWKYEAVPYSFHTLFKQLSKIPSEATDLVRADFDGNYGIFIHRGAKLLANIFPVINSPFAAKLIEIIHTNDDKNFLFVLAILRNYEGEIFTHEICKQLVIALPSDSHLANEVRIALQSTGVVSGEYGFVILYEKKIREIEYWLTDPSIKVQKFAKNYIAWLEARIAYEKNRADEEIILRKHQYGDDEDENDEIDET